MGTNTSLAPPRAWSPKGQRAYCWVPRNWGKNATLLSSGSYHCRGLRDLSRERVLSPTLRPGQEVVMDNLTAHKGERVRKLIEFHTSRHWGE